MKTFFGQLKNCLNLQSCNIVCTQRHFHIFKGGFKYLFSLLSELLFKPLPSLTISRMYVNVQKTHRKIRNYNSETISTFLKHPVLFEYVENVENEFYFPSS